MLVELDQHGVAIVTDHSLLSFVSGGLSEGVSANSGCEGNATCGSYNNAQCGPTNNECGPVIIDAICGANNSCPLVNAGACGGGTIDNGSDVKLEVHPQNVNVVC